MRGLLIFGLILCGAAGCPRRFDPSAKPPLPEGGVKEARSRFDQARARFENAEYGGATPEFQAIVREYPDDPIAPYATLYAGMSAHRQGDPAAAAATLEPLVADEKAPEEVRRRARFYLGLSEAAVGRHAEARALLTPFVGDVTADEDEGELHAALAESAAAQGDLVGALQSYDRFFGLARPAERAYVTSRVAAIVDGMDPGAAAAAWDKVGHDGPSGAYLGRRLAAVARAQGAPDRAAAILSETAAARHAVGLEIDEPRASGVGDPQLVGAVLPLSGRRRLVGEAAARGLTLAAGTYDRGNGGGVAVDGVPLPFEVSLEDAGEARIRAGSAVESLAAAGAIAVVGPVDRDAVEEATGRAAALGLPLMTLDVAEAPPTAAPTVFRVVLSVEDRARALAAHAVARGVKRFAILAPDIAYGTRAVAAFKAELAARGGEVVVEERYKKETTSFVDVVGRLAKAAPFDGLFIPDTAARLELVAPQLAVADLVVQAPGEKKPKRGRAVFLVSTAEAITPKFLRGSGRYTKGATLAPGFYPDENDARIGPYVARFRVAYGEEPTYLDAYAYDAAIAVRAAVEAGAKDRASLAAAIAGYSVQRPLFGLTGDVWFEKGSHARGDAGLLYSVVADGTGFAVRAIRGK